MGYLKRTVDEAIEFAEKQHANPTQNWHNLCQSFCRQSYGVGAWAPSAKDAWNSIPNNKKTILGRPSDCPRGGLIYFDSGTYGHVALAIGKSTNDNCWSNDYVRDGKIDKAPRDFPRWGLHYAGWSAWTPFGEMNLNTEPPPLWDGKVPSLEGCFNAMNDYTLANPQAYRIAARLYDLGFYAGKPVEGQQKYPAKAIKGWQEQKGWRTEPLGAYSPLLHDRLFG